MGKLAAAIPVMLGTGAGTATITHNSTLSVALFLGGVMIAIGIAWRARGYQEYLRSEFRCIRRRLDRIDETTGVDTSDDR